jgi:hypothetical protein
MSFKKLYSFILVLAMIIVVGSIAEAQLLQDRNKLRTVKKKGGFVLFEKKVSTKKPSGKHTVERASSPRFSQPVQVPGDTRVLPRYSISSAGQGDDYRGVPRTSAIRAGQGDDYRGVPRTTKIRAGQGDDFNVNPRFTRVISQRAYVVKPRFSKPPTKEKLAPSNNEKAGFNGIFNRSEDPADHQSLSSTYSGDMNTRAGLKKNRSNSKDMHPSSNHISAKHNNNKLVRNSKRKINIVWVRMNGNKIQPKSVKEKVKKSKFDKDEIEIWNN